MGICIWELTVCLGSHRLVAGGGARENRHHLAAPARARISSIALRMNLDYLLSCDFCNLVQLSSHAGRICAVSSWQRKLDTGKLINLRYFLRCHIKADRNLEFCSKTGEWLSRKRLAQRLTSFSSMIQPGIASTLHPGTKHAHTTN